MELKLFLLDVGNSEVGRLVLLYSLDEVSAWGQVARWSVENNTPIPKNAKLIELPYDFKIHLSSLPRTINTEQTE